MMMERKRETVKEEGEVFIVFRAFDPVLCSS
jgi:hypothetical protein